MDFANSPLIQFPVCTTLLLSLLHLCPICAFILIFLSVSHLFFPAPPFPIFLTERWAKGSAAGSIFFFFPPSPSVILVIQPLTRRERFLFDLSLFFQPKNFRCTHTHTHIHTHTIHQVTGETKRKIHSSAQFLFYFFPSENTKIAFEMVLSLFAFVCNFFCEKGEERRSKG